MKENNLATHYQNIISHSSYTLELTCSNIFADLWKWQKQIWFMCLVFPINKRDIQVKKISIYPHKNLQYLNKTMMMSPRLVNAYESNKPYLAMLLVQTIYAGMALLSKASISSGMNPFIFVVYRQAFATFALAPIAYFVERFDIHSSICWFPNWSSTSYRKVKVFCFFLCRNNVFKLSYTLLWKIFFSSLIG